MNANDVIETYVTDVARRLPRRQRNDVAFELRALLREELADRAEASGGLADAAMAIDLLRNFGRPAEVAARYRPPLEIIDPSDARLFLRATVIGMAVWWIAGLFEHFGQPAGESGPFLTSLGRWWMSSVIASLWWPGMLVVGFATGAWVRRRWPQRSHWSPHAVDDFRASRVGLVFAILGIVLGVSVLWDPRVMLDLVFRHGAAYAAYEALTYTPPFREGAAPWLFGALLLYVPIYFAVMLKGRWSPRLRRLEDALGAVTASLMVWVLLGGPAFSSAASDGLFKLVLLLSLALTVFTWWHRYRRRVAPAPASTALP
jgi:hypothetical protein